MATLNYRADIDGLRALAVLAVVFFHAGMGVPGGYVGVDVFFVISGYLITSLLWKDLQAGQFSLLRFWERRARRIVPALVVVTLATLVASACIMLPVDLHRLGQAAAAQAVFAANIHYWLHEDYFAPLAITRPLLHAWSLAVEEQFYLLMPLLLWGLFAWRSRTGSTGVPAALGLVLVGSLGLSVWMVEYHPAAGFYLLPSRAWEMLAGSMLVFIPPAGSESSRAMHRQMASALGLFLILIPMFLYQKTTAFPGAAALAPCVGAAMIIWAGPTTLVNALLARRPMVFIGLVSYSFYLWHWPVLALLQYRAIHELPLSTRAGAVGLSLLLAVLSWRFVETPFRTRRRLALPGPMLAGSAVGLLVMFAAGYGLHLHGKETPDDSPAMQYALAANAGALLTEVTLDQVQSGDLIPLGVAEGEPQLLVWGDSHARVALPAVDAFLQTQGLSGVAACHSATPPVLDWTRANLGNIAGYNQAVLAYLRQRRIAHVLMIAHWNYYPAGHHEAAFKEALLAAVREVSRTGAKPWVMKDVPAHPFDVPRAMYQATLEQRDLEQIRTDATLPLNRDMIDPGLAQAIRDLGGEVIDPRPAFLDASGQHYIVHKQGQLLYFDHTHLTAQGARLMLTPLLQRELILQPAGPATQSHMTPEP